LLVLNGLEALYLRPEPLGCFYFILLVCAAGGFVLSTDWFVICAGLIVLPAIVVSWKSGLLAAWPRLGICLAGSTLLAGWLHRLRRNSCRELEAYRGQQEDLRSKLAEATETSRINEERFIQLSSAA